MKIALPLIFGLLLNLYSYAQTDLVTYAGDTGREAFYDVHQLSDGTFLVAGFAESLSWIDPSIAKTELDPLNINNNQGGNDYGFLLHFDATLENMLHVVHFPAGAVEDVRFIKTTNTPQEPTSQIYISGNTLDTKSNGGGYFIARLNNNFVSGIPTGIDWAFNVWAEGYAKQNHPWDVDAEGRVVYGRGQSHAYDWASIHQLNPQGEREVVPRWRTHWKVAGGEFYGVGESYPGGLDSLSHSGIVLKEWGRCDLRSWTEEDHSFAHGDGNGGQKTGLWPLDVFYKGPCDPADPSANGPGYTGYKTGATPVHGFSSVVIDKRTGRRYFGMNIKSILPDGNPDFEPAVWAMDAEGELLWWSRLYHEVRPAGDTVNSTPDQYVDALAIDYSVDPEEAFLVVNGRCHGNNIENFWEGNHILANSNAQGFQNNFTGSSGNIHISWLGKLKLADGTLHHSTYVAEYAEGATGFGAPHPNPNLDNWPNPNAGWPTLNTTRLARNNMKVTADGSVCVLGTGRRTITTANAYQKMVLPANGGLSSWNSYVRVYSPGLSLPLYSSLVVGQWDTLTQQGGGNTRLFGIWKTASGVVAVGLHQEDNDQPGVSKGEPIPVANVPIWGVSTPESQSAVLVRFEDPFIENEMDGPPMPSASIEQPVSGNLKVVPNPVGRGTEAEVLLPSPLEGLLRMIDMRGQVVWELEVNPGNGDRVALPTGFPTGVYLGRLEVKNGDHYVFRLIILPE